MLPKFRLVNAGSFIRLWTFAWLGGAIWLLYKETSPISCSIATLLAFIASVGYFRPALLEPFRWFWSRIGWAISLITVPVLVSVLYYLMITPVAKFRRRQGYDPLDLQISSDLKTYWRPYSQSKSMRRPF